MSRPRLLDLFCGGGGAAMGYHRAGFDVTGVDLDPQPNYPFAFHQADALTWPLDGYDVIHASPPCQLYSTLHNTAQHIERPDLYAPTRERLTAQSTPWIIENVIGAPYRSGFVLCGSMFGMRVRRHRNFESSLVVLLDRHCDHVGQGQPLGVYGMGGSRQTNGAVRGRPADYPTLMGMPWATPKECTQAIPPAYTEWIGARLLAAIETEGTAA